MGSHNYSGTTINMAPYSSYSSSISASRLSSYSPSPRTYTLGKDVNTSAYSYKPSVYTSTLPSPSWSRPPTTLNRHLTSTKYTPTTNSVYSSTTWRSPSSHELQWVPPARNSYSTSSFRSTASTLSPLYPTNLSSLDAVEKKRRGLNNLGNTCFMNAILQCLCHTPPLVDYCNRDRYQTDINHRSSTSGDLMKAFADIVKQLSDSKSKQGAVSPLQLQRQIQRFAPRFEGTRQQDAQELLRFLLQGLHEDIKKPTTLKNSYKGDAWQTYKETEDSFVVDLFGGLLKSTLKCMICNNESITYDPFWDLSLPIPEKYRATYYLQQCFNLFSSSEVLDGVDKPLCEKCKKKTKCTKELEISRFPKVLVIHLKRFSSTSPGQKLTMMIECPLHLTNTFGSSSRSGSYSLYGVIDHAGTNRSGHYTAKCWDFHAKEWNEFSDTRVSPTKSIVTNDSYILFYIQE